MAHLADETDQAMQELQFIDTEVRQKHCWDGYKSFLKDPTSLTFSSLDFSEAR